MESKKKLKQEKLLCQMQQEIKNLEYEIEHAGIKNLKIGAIRNLKITARVFQFISPYILMAGIGACVFKATGFGWPFYPNDKFARFAYTKTELDNLGNINFESQYEYFDHSENLLTYYSKWEKQENGLFYRTIKKYNIGNITKEEVLKIFDNQNVSLDEIFGAPISNEQEVSDSVEKNQELLQAVIFEENMDDFIYGQETWVENGLITIVYLIITGFGGLCFYYFKDKHSNVYFWKQISDIKEKYRFIDQNALVKKLEIRKNNYDRLTR